MLTLAEVKAKSAKVLDSGLHTTVRHSAERLIELAYKAGVPILLVQGRRTNTEQAAIYAKGRMLLNGRWTVVNKSAVVSNAEPGESMHNYGLAVDFALLMPDGRAVSWDTYRDGDNDRKRDWLEVAAIGKSLGFAWGGDWNTFIDMPHLEMSFGLTIKQLIAGKRPPVQMPIPKLPEVVKVDIKVNGKKIAEGEVRSGVTWVPIRVISETLGAAVAYDSSTKTVYITPKGDK